jgi:acetyl-CoA carboxylase biotin carboxyl carrier protein
MNQHGVTPNGTVVAEPQQRGTPGGAHRPGPPAVGATDELQMLCTQAAELVGRLPGNLRRLMIRGIGYAMKIEWHEVGQPAAATTLPVSPGTSHPAALPPADECLAPGPEAGGVPGGAHVIVAPLVGTFHRAPEPGAAPFVEVGDHVGLGQTVGIVEAMKLMNPVLSETAGRIGAIYVGNGEPVEFGQSLVRVDVVADTRRPDRPNRS